MTATKRPHNLILLLTLSFIILVFGIYITPANALSPYRPRNYQPFVLRASFSTNYSKSTKERKHNIELALNSIHKTFIEQGAEFSFNKTVGARTVSRGYKSAKIIANGKFIDGIGGGVCQVSTTLYNAVLLAGLKVTEYHPHSLAVSYCAPSFDAMVNSGGADLRFVNNSGMPVYILTKFNGEDITISIYGEKMQYKIERKGVVKEYLDLLEPEILIDDAGEYPELYEGERLTVSYGKRGIKSEGYLIYKDKSKTVSVQKIRNDKYSSIKGVVVIGTQKRPAEEVKSEEIA